MVRGKVGNSYADWGRSADGNKRIYTFYDLAVSEVLKGKVKGNSLLMREMGGEKDGVGMEVPGASHFERGEDVVVMLGERNPDGSYDLRGLMTGKMNVELNQSGNEVLVGPAVQGVESHMGGQSDTEPRKEWTLSALRDLIRTQAEGSASEANNQNSKTSVVAQPSTAPSQSAAPGSPSPAPQLQNSSPEDPKPSSKFGFPVWAGLALGVGIFAAFLKKRTRA